MKQLVKCQVTGKLFPVALCYQTEVEKETNGVNGDYRVEKIKGYVSAYANKKLGFKTNQVKYEKALRVIKGNKLDE